MHISDSITSPELRKWNAGSNDLPFAPTKIEKDSSTDSRTNRDNEEEERANKSPLPTGFSSLTSPQPLPLRAGGRALRSTKRMNTKCRSRGKIRCWTHRVCHAWNWLRRPRGCSPRACDSGAPTLPVIHDSLRVGRGGFNLQTEM